MPKTLKFSQIDENSPNMVTLVTCKAYQRLDITERFVNLSRNIAMDPA